MNAPPASAAVLTVATATTRSCGPHHNGPVSIDPSGAVPRPRRCCDVSCNVSTIATLRSTDRQHTRGCDVPQTVTQIQGPSLHNPNSGAIHTTISPAHKCCNDQLEPQRLWATRSGLMAPLARTECRIWAVWVIPCGGGRGPPQRDTADPPFPASNGDLREYDRHIRTTLL